MCIWPEHVLKCAGASSLKNHMYIRMFEQNMLQIFTAIKEPTARKHSRLRQLDVRET